MKTQTLSYFSLWLLVQIEKEKREILNTPARTQQDRKSTRPPHDHSSPTLSFFPVSCPGLWLHIMLRLQLRAFTFNSNTFCNQFEDVHTRARPHTQTHTHTICSNRLLSSALCLYLRYIYVFVLCLISFYDGFIVLVKRANKQRTSRREIRYLHTHCLAFYLY